MDDLIRRLNALEEWRNLTEEFIRTAIEDSQLKQRAIDLLKQEVFEQKAMMEVLRGEVSDLMARK